MDDEPLVRTCTSKSAPMPSAQAWRGSVIAVRSNGQAALLPNPQRCLRDESSCSVDYSLLHRIFADIVLSLAQAPQEEKSFLAGRPTKGTGQHNTRPNVHRAPFRTCGPGEIRARKQRRCYQPEITYCERVDSMILGRAGLQQNRYIALKPRCCAAHTVQRTAHVPLAGRAGHRGAGRG